MNKNISELDPKQVFNFVGYQLDLTEGRVRPTQERWQTLQAKIRDLMTGPETIVPDRVTDSYRDASALRLHMRPIQWHLKNNWRVQETLEKVISIPKSPHPHLRWWLEEDHVLTGQPLHPLKMLCKSLQMDQKKGGVLT